MREGVVDPEARGELAAVVAWGVPQSLCVTFVVLICGAGSVASAIVRRIAVVLRICMHVHTAFVQLSFHRFPMLLFVQRSTHRFRAAVNPPLSCSGHSHRFRARVHSKGILCCPYESFHIMFCSGGVLRSASFFANFVRHG